MAGRRPLPTEIKRIKGTLQKCRTNRDEPIPPTGEIHLPEHLDSRARAEWRRLRPILERRGVLTCADYATFAVLCQQISLANRAAEQIAAEGVLPSGKAHPLLKVLNDASRQVLKLCAEFGMTPAARGRVKQDQNPKNPNPWDGLIT